jgi:hypothetical protein
MPAIPFPEAVYQKPALDPELLNSLCLPTGENPGALFVCQLGTRKIALVLDHSPVPDHSRVLHNPLRREIPLQPVPVSGSARSPAPPSP